MATLSNKRIRLAADTARLDAPADLLTGFTPAFYRGNDLRVEFAIFDNDTLMEASNIASATLEIKAMADETTPPDAEDSVLMAKTITTFNNTLTPTNWQNGSDEHGVFEFSAAQSNIAAGLNWMSLWVTTTDNPAKTITLVAGPINVVEDGASGSVQAPPPPAENYYTATQSDARFLTKGGNLGELMDASAARLNLGLGSAATANTGVTQGTVPVLNSEGKLPASVVPSGGTVAESRGVVFDGGSMSFPNFVIGSGDFDLLVLLRRNSIGGEQYILSGASGALGLRFIANNRLRVSVIGVADILESSSGLGADETAWVRLSRREGYTRIYIGESLVGSLADSLGYSGAQNSFGANAGANTLRATVLRAVLFNRGLSDEEVAEFKENAVVAPSDRWGSQTNSYNASSLTVGKRVYVKTTGSESITINGVTYGNGSGNTNATAGVEITVASASISNNLTSASTLKYVGAVADWDFGVGCGFQLHDRSANGAHGLLSESGCEHLLKERRWMLVADVAASGYVGANARAVLPEGHVITHAVTIGGSGVTLDLGEAPSGESLANNHVCASGKAAVTLVGVAASNNRLYATYASGSGNLTVVVEGIIV